VLGAVDAWAATFVGIARAGAALEVIGADSVFLALYVAVCGGPTFAARRLEGTSAIRRFGGLAGLAAGILVPIVVILLSAGTHQLLTGSWEWFQVLKQLSAYYAPGIVCLGVCGAAAGTAIGAVSGVRPFPWGRAAFGAISSAVIAAAPGVGHTSLSSMKIFEGIIMAVVGQTPDSFRAGMGVFHGPSPSSLFGWLSWPWIAALVAAGAGMPFWIVILESAGARKWARRGAVIGAILAILGIGALTAVLLMRGLAILFWPLVLELALPAPFLGGWLGGLAGWIPQQVPEGRAPVRTEPVTAMAVINGSLGWLEMIACWLLGMTCLLAAWGALDMSAQHPVNGYYALFVICIALGILGLLKIDAGQALLADGRSGRRRTLALGAMGGLAALALVGRDPLALFDPFAFAVIAAYLLYGVLAFATLLPSKQSVNWAKAHSVAAAGIALVASVVVGGLLVRTASAVYAARAANEAIIQARSAEERAGEEERSSLERGKTAAERIFSNEHRTLRGHTASVSCVAFSPDGMRVVSGSADKLAKLWSAATGQEILTLKGHVGAVSGVAVSPDGKRIATASDDATLKVWDAGSGQEVLTLKGHVGPVLCVAYSPDGTRIVSGGADYTLRFWDALTGSEIRRRSHDEVRDPHLTKSPGVCRVAFSADGKWLATGNGDGVVDLLDGATGQLTRDLSRHSEPVQTVAFSPDAKRIITGDEYTWTIWDVVTGEEINRPVSEPRSVGTSVVFSPDGKWIVGKADAPSHMAVWDGFSYLRVRELTDVGEIASIAFSRDGKRLAVGCEDNSVRVWDIASKDD
jgi:WD40 repeat protein